MKKIRLKADCQYPTMSTPYGVIGHEWVEVDDGKYVYKEMEVFGEKLAEPVEELIAATITKEIVEEAPKEEPKSVKKKRRSKRKRRTF